MPPIIPVINRAGLSSTIPMISVATVAPDRNQRAVGSFCFMMVVFATNAPLACDYEAGRLSLNLSGNRVVYSNVISGFFKSICLS